MVMLEVAMMEYIALWLGTILSMILCLLLIFILVKTPAKVWIKAIIGKSPIGIGYDRANRCEFSTGKETLKGTLKIKRVGPVTLTEGSAMFDKVSKVPIFFYFNENNTSIPAWWPSVLQELREHGIKITKYSDYRDLLALRGAGDFDTVARRYVEPNAIDKPWWNPLAKNKPADEEKIAKAVEYLRAAEVNLQTYKTYKLHELTSMFPNNTTPMNIDAYAREEVARVLRKNDQIKYLIIAAVAVLILAIAFALIWKVVGSGTAPQVTVQLGADAIKDIVANQSITV